MAQAREALISRAEEGGCVRKKGAKMIGDERHLPRGEIEYAEEGKQKVLGAGMSRRRFLQMDVGALARQQARPDLHLEPSEYVVATCTRRG
jgi:hypothetical protein